MDAACNIRLICKIMVDASIGDNVERLAKLRTMQSAWLSVPPVEEFTTQLQDRIASKDADPDYWGFQTCAEFGFYQTCEVGSQCMYLQGFVTLASMMDFCTSQYVSSAIYIVVTCYPCVWSSKHHAVYREGVVLVCYPCVWSSKHHAVYREGVVLVCDPCVWSSKHHAVYREGVVLV